MMNNSGKALASACAVACLTILALTFSTQAQPRHAAQSRVETRRVERGKYLVTIMFCNDCHTPYKMGANGPEPDMTRMLSGHPETMKLPPPPKPVGPWVVSFTGTNTAFAGPWGISYTINLTPDKNTGIGGGVWSEEVFIKAMRTGKHFGTSRPIQPPMPWPWIGKATDEDLRAIWAYLMSIPPITNHVPDYEPPTAPGQPPPPAKKGAPKK